MTISQIANEVVAAKSAKLIRYRKESVASGVAQYDAKDLFTGSKRGWTILDLTTASALCAVFGAEAIANVPERRAKLENLPLGRLVDFCWKVLR